MKTSMQKISITSVVLITILTLTCKDKKDDTNTNLLALYLLQGDRTDTTNLNTPLGRASATANVVSTISTSTVNPSSQGNITFLNSNGSTSLQRQLFVITEEIYKNGKDPIVSRRLIRKFISEYLSNSSDEKILTGWTGPTTVNGRTQYTYSGTAKGKKYVKSNTTATFFTPQGTALPCTVNWFFGSGSIAGDQGTAVFSNGVISRIGTVFTDVQNRADIVFTDFGTLYTDAFAQYKDIKNNGTSQINSCADAQAAIDRYDRFTKNVTVSGPLSFDFSQVFTGSFGSTLTLKMKSTSNSSGLILSDGNTTTPALTIENLVYEYDFSIVQSGTSFTGTLMTTISGKLNGETLTETLSISY